MLKALSLKFVFMFLIVSLVYNDGLKAQALNYSPLNNLNIQNNNQNVNSAIRSLANIQTKINNVNLCFINSLSTKETWYTITGVSAYISAGSIIFIAIDVLINDGRTTVFEKLFKNKVILGLFVIGALGAISGIAHTFLSIENDLPALFIFGSNDANNTKQENFKTLAMLLGEADFINNDLNSLPFHVAEILVNNSALLAYIAEFENELLAEEADISFSEFLEVLNNEGIDTKNIDPFIVYTIEKCLQKA